MLTRTNTDAPAPGGGVAAAWEEEALTHADAC
jgi:hypothetical protein